jgi:general secretion pathway protein D
MTPRSKLAAVPVIAAISLMAAAAGAKPKPVAPVETPATPAIVAEGEPAARELRATILGGQAPVPAPPQAGAIQPVVPGDTSLNFPSADVSIVARAVLGDVLHMPYTIAPGVNAQVSLVTPGPVARSSLLGLFETALRNGGLALISSGGGFQIQPIAAAQGNGPVESGVVGFGTEIVRLQFINADELKRLFDSVLPGVATAVDPAQNALTIAGTTGQRASAHDLIGQFDVNWLRNMSFALFVPQRTDSRLIVPELEKLINAPDAPTRGLVRLIAMERLNGILAVSAQPQYIEDVRRWIDILDREGESSQARLFVYRVQNGRARDLARTLNNAFSGGSGDRDSGNGDPFNTQPAASDGSAGGQTSAAPPAMAPTTNDRAASGRTGDAQAPSRPSGLAARITADETNNAIIVYGTPHDYAVVEDALRRLDIPPMQVLIEAAITEVSLTDDLRFGVQWNFQTGSSNFALSEGTTVSPTRILPGFSYFYSGNDISATLNALEQRTNVKVISAPKLLVLNNQTAALQVGDQVPVQTQSSVSTDGNSPIINSIQYRDTGVILRVTPRVNAGGLVLLDISQEVSDVSNTTTSEINSPTIATRRIATTVAVQDGQVIALGGLFRNSQTFGKNGLPILSRIPVLGSMLFGNTKNMQRRTELIVLIKPRVVRSIDDGRAITEELRAKLRTLEPFKTQGRIP